MVGRPTSSYYNRHSGDLHHDLDQQGEKVHDSKRTAGSECSAVLNLTVKRDWFRTVPADVPLSLPKSVTPTLRHGSSADSRRIRVRKSAKLTRKLERVILNYLS